MKPKDPMLFRKKYSNGLLDPRNPQEVSDYEFARAKAHADKNCPEEKKEAVAKFLEEVEQIRNSVKNSPLWKAMNEKN